jgi:hypothetical protein
VCNVDRMADVPRIWKAMDAFKNPGIVTVQDGSLGILRAWSSFDGCFIISWCSMSEGERPAAQHTSYDQT